MYDVCNSRLQDFKALEVEIFELIRREDPMQYAHSATPPYVHRMIIAAERTCARLQVFLFISDSQP